MNPRKQLFAAAVVLILGLVLSFIGSKFLFDYTLEQKNLSIERHAESKAEELQFHINNSLNMLTAVSAFLQSDQDINDVQFKEFIYAINEKFQGAVVIAWVPKILGKERMEFEKYLPASSFGTRHIMEINYHGLRTMAPKREVYFPIRFVASDYGDELFAGLNITSLNKTKPYIEKAIKYKSLLTTGRINMQGRLTGQLLYQALLPVFTKRQGKSDLNTKEKLQGIILAIF